MRLEVSEILLGGAQALTTVPAEEAAGDYAAGMAGVVAMLCVLAAQEAEGAAAVRRAENREMRALLGEAASGQDDDVRLGALDEAGDRLREALIGVHVQAEENGDVVLESAILRLLHRMAHARRLSLAP